MPLRINLPILQAKNQINTSLYLTPRIEKGAFIRIEVDTKAGTEIKCVVVFSS